MNLKSVLSEFNAAENPGDELIIKLNPVEETKEGSVEDENEVLDEVEDEHLCYMKVFK